MINKDTKYKFPIFQSTQDAVSEGLSVDSFDPNLPRKHWVDPNPKTNEDGECEYKVFQYKGGIVQVDPATGKPKFKTLRISPELARRFNIYDPPFDGSKVELKLEETPFPIRELKEDEEWKFGFMAEPSIVKKIQNKEIESVGEISSKQFQALLDSISERIDIIDEKVNRIMLVLGGK